MKNIGSLLIISGSLVILRQIIRIGIDPISCLLVPIAALALGFALIFS